MKHNNYFFGFGYIIGCNLLDVQFPDVGTIESIVKTTIEIVIGIISLINLIRNKTKPQNHNGDANPEA